MAELETDVVVVGSGAGALTGALTAASEGFEVVVLEKTPHVGGTSAYSGAACWLPGSRVQERAGLVDDSAEVRRYLEALVPQAEAARVEAFLATAPRLVDFLEEHPDLEFAWQPFPDYVDAPGRHPQGRSIVPLELEPERLGDLLALVRPPVQRDRWGRGHRDAPLDGGRALIGRLLLALQATDRARVLASTPMTELRVDGDRVAGVEAVGDDGPLTVHARQGVLLAAGGFEADAQMRARHATPGQARWSMGPAGANTGDAIRAGIAVGAATDLLDEAWWCPALELADGSAAFLLGFRGGVLVDANGHRFANESLPYDQMGRVLAERPDERVPCWLVFDDREGGGVPAISMPGARPEDQLAAGAWVRADDLEELASATGLPADVLSETVAAFNRAAEHGVDEEFGRGEDPYDRFFVAPAESPNPCLVPLDQPPFTAARVVLGDLGTKGGLVTDADARVLRDDGTPIEGLYASSNSVASLSGRCYPAPGIPLGTAMVFAHLAMCHLAG